MSKIIKQYIVYCKKECYCQETGQKIMIGDFMLYIPAIKGKQKSQTYCFNSNFYKQATSTEQMSITGYKI